MAGQFVNNLSSGNFGSDGVYVYQAPAQPVTPTGPAVNKLGVVGTGQWNLKGTPVPFTRASDGYAAFGPNTAINNSIMRDSLAAMPECNSFVGVRVTDGTDVAATIVVTDASAIPVFTLTAIYTGSLPNGVNAAGVVSNPAQAQLTFAAGTISAGPVLRLSVSFPNSNTESWNIVAYQTAGGPFSPSVFKANLVAAINVGTATAAPSQRWTATTGSSSNPPQISPAFFNASGGTDGATTITSAILAGQDGITGRTGLYALRGAIQGSQYIFAGFTDTTYAQTMVTFNRGEGVRSAISFPIGTATQGAINLKTTNSASDPTLDTCIDWDQMIDPWSGVLTYVAPAAKVSGIIASLGWWQSPSNKPYTGAVGIVATERSATPISVAEAAQRQQAGLMYLTNPINRGVMWGLPHGIASDGVSNIADVRASNFIGLSLFQVLGPFVGEGQSQLANDPVRLAARSAVNQFMNTLLTPTPKISGFSNVLDTSNNTPTTIAQGFMYVNLSVQTLAGTKFILVTEQVGTNVQLTVKSS